MNKVTLSYSEMHMVSAVAMLRWSTSREMGLKHKVSNEWTWENEFNGAAAEMAFCKFTDRFWTGSVNSFHGPDVGKNIQIRSTTKHSNRLLIRQGDPSEHYYVLVTGFAPEFYVVGWMKGEEAKQLRWLTNPGGLGEIYLVPQEALNPEFPNRG